MTEKQGLPTIAPGTAPTEPPSYPKSPYGLSDAQVTTLMSPLRSSRVAHRSQGSSQLSYLEAYDVKAHLIRLFHFGGCNVTADECETVSLTEVTGSNGKTNWQAVVRVRVTLHVKVLDATYSAYCVSSQKHPDPGEAMDFATKTAESDALKRCATFLGTQFGLSLYNKGNLNDIVVGIYPSDLDIVPQVEATDETVTNEGRDTPLPDPTPSGSEA